MKSKVNVVVVVDIRITKIENKDATGYINPICFSDWTFYFSNNGLIILLMGF